MSEFKPNRFSEIFGESEEKQARWVNSYLENQCEHLREGIQHHDDCFEATVYLNQLAAEVMPLAKEGSETLDPNILRRITEFETVSGAKEPQVPTVEPCITLPKDHPGITRLLKEIEELSHSDATKESWESFQSTRKSLEDVLGLLESLPVADSDEPKGLGPKDSQLRMKRNLRKKINTFNGFYEACPEAMGDTSRLFKNCFSASRCSLNLITEDAPKEKDSGSKGDTSTKVELPGKQN